MKYLIVLLTLSILPLGSMAQPSPREGSTTQAFTLNATQSKYVIEGTSSLHDWEMVSEKCKGSVSYTYDGQNLSFQYVKVQVPVKSLESGKSLMDKKCYDALKEKKFPIISYEFKSMSNLKSTGSGAYSAVFTGNLTIAGNTKSVPIDVTIQVSNNNVQIKGRKPITMSDYGVEPPTALLGTIKTGDDITIDFNLNYN